MSSKLDPISVLESAYQPAGDRARWLALNAPAIAASLDVDGFGCLSYFLRDDAMVPTDIVYRAGSRGMDGQRALAGLQAGAVALTPEQRARGWRALQQPGAHGFLDTFGEISQEARAEQQGWDEFIDSPAVVIPTGEHVVALACSYIQRRFELSDEQQQLWERVSIHLGAACRLSTREASAEASDVEAVLDLSGRVVHARDEARAAHSRELLCDAVRGIERARTRAGRAEPTRALELWQGLWGGRWSLVDHADTDGRRFVLARRNDPDPTTPFPLTRRQRQVLFYAAVGWSLKQIAYALGLASEGSVSGHLRKALDTLGLRSRVELIRVTSQWAATVADSAAAATERDDDRELTTAERAIAEHVFEGLSNREIATRRGVSERTVANQLACIYRKLGFHDRHELVRWLSARQSRA